MKFNINYSKLREKLKKNEHTQAITLLDILNY
jgi:hypothetical protein